MSNYIDKIFYINLEKRQDRKAEIESELSEFDLMSNSERYNAIENSMGILGCTMSHLNVFKLAKERGYKNVLILEDDFTFIVSKEEFEQNLKLFFDNEIDYDVLMLSYNLIRNEPVDEFPFIGKVIEAQTASSYIVNSRYYDKLINLYEYAIPLLSTTAEHWNYANDQIWKCLQKKDNWYYFTQRIGRQRPSYSDNSECFMDHGL